MEKKPSLDYIKIAVQNDVFERVFAGMVSNSSIIKEFIFPWMSASLNYEDEKIKSISIRDSEFNELVSVYWVKEQWTSQKYSALDFRGDLFNIYEKDFYESIIIKIFEKFEITEKNRLMRFDVKQDEWNRNVWEYVPKVKYRKPRNYKTHGLPPSWQEYKSKIGTSSSSVYKLRIYDKLLDIIEGHQKTNIKNIFGEKKYAEIVKEAETEKKVLCRKEIEVGRKLIKDRGWTIAILFKEKELEKILKNYMIEIFGARLKKQKYENKNWEKQQHFISYEQKKKHIKANCRAYLGLAHEHLTEIEREKIFKESFYLSEKKMWNIEWNVRKEAKEEAFLEEIQKLKKILSAKEFEEMVKKIFL